jgi:hypothetical protein
MSPNVYLLVDLVLSGGINYLLQKQQVDALLTLALTEQRDITVAELNTLKVERDRVSDEINALLDGVS